jgi:hypothetical protein
MNLLLSTAGASIVNSSLEGAASGPADALLVGTRIRRAPITKRQRDKAACLALPRFWGANQWIACLRMSAADSWRESVHAIPLRKCVSDGFSTNWGTATGCTLGTYQENQILCFHRVNAYYLCMAATGTGTRGVRGPSRRDRVSNFGKGSSRRPAHAIRGSYANLRTLGGA